MHHKFKKIVAFMLAFLLMAAPLSDLSGGTAYAASTDIISKVAGIAGTGGFSGDGGAATSGKLNYPIGAAVDSNNNLYIADTGNARIRKVDHTSGKITTVAGTGTLGYSGDGGLATSAEFTNPAGVAVDKDDNLYIVDSTGYTVRKVDHVSGNISIVAGTGARGYSGDGGQATSAKLMDPVAIAVDNIGNLYIAEYDGNRIRKVEPSGQISTVAGTGIAGYSGDDGLAKSAQLNKPIGVAVDRGNNLYIAEFGNHTIRKVDVSTKKISTVAGTGTSGFSGDGGAATSAKLNGPNAIATDGLGNLYIADALNWRIRKVEYVSGQISTVTGSGLPYTAGDGGLATLGRIKNPSGLVVDSSGILYIVDNTDHVVRKIGPPSNNANLGNLTLSSGTLSPSFESGTTSYTVSVANNVNFLLVKPTVSDSNASVKVNGAMAYSGSNSRVNLNSETTTITIDVTAQDTTVQKTYTVSVSKEATPIRTLASTAKTDTTAAFSWSAASGATGIIIEQSPTGQNNWTTATTGTIATNATTATVTGLSAATGYDFRLVVTGGANAGNSDMVSVTTDAALTYTIAPMADRTLYPLDYGYGSGTQELKTLTIINMGTGRLTNLSATLNGPGGNHFEITQPDSSLNITSATIFTIKAKDGLAGGTYTATVTISATNLMDVTFAITQVVGLPNVPANPQNLAAIGGNGQVALNWSTVTEATYYNLYLSTTAGQFSDTADATVTSSTYNVQELTNGTTYYFIVKAGNPGGLSAASNQVSATPATVPAAPTNISAVAGDGQATISFTAPTDNGGSPITGYEVTASPGNVVMTGTASPIIFTGLTNGTSYSFTVKAVNGTGSSTSSVQSNDITPSLSSGGGNGNGDTYTIAPMADRTLYPLDYGYGLGTQELKTLTIINMGTGRLTNLSATLNDPGGNYFEITQPDSSLNTTSATIFTVKAKDGLAGGTYTATVTISATNLPDVTFTITQVVNLPNVPANPQNLAVTGGNGQVALNWSTVTEATYYNLYLSTTAGQFSDTAVTTVTSSTYNVQNLTNGTTYYFIVKAGNPGGLSAASNQVSATPATVPAAPTNISAVAGDGQATISFTAPADNGGITITGYEVTASPGNVFMTGTASPVIFTGLTNGTSYSFTVKAVNGAGSSTSSVQSNEVTPSPSSGGGNGNGDTPSEPTTPTTTETGTIGVDVLVNGKVENAGTATTSKRSGQTVTTVAVDQKKLNDKLAAEGQGAVVTIPVNTKSEVVVGELNGQMVKNLENKQAVLEIKTGQATYTLPAEQISIDSISNQMGQSVALQDIKIQIEISVPTAGTLKVVENAAAKGTFTLVAPPIDFTVKATYEGTTVQVSKFNAYVERTIAIPDSVDPTKITTGVVVEPDGTVRHVPTKIVVVDGKYYAIVNSLTNSTYSVVWHPIEFSDVANHWAKNAVNDMGSRMVISGIGNDQFSPDRNITRAEFAAIIIGGLGLKLENGTTSFSDVKISDWYSSAVNTAHAYDLINGFEDGSFRPNDSITREEAMMIVARAMKITKLEAKFNAHATEDILGSFADAATASNWALDSIADCVLAGLVSGRNGDELAPQAYISRAEAAVIVQRLLQKSELI